MAWDHLDFDKPHLAYIIIGGFTSLFMLCSSFVKEKLYIGEATVATACGIIFGPHAANLFNPISWGNVDKITLETSRIVLVVQCFAVGVELPKAYMERHWRSVTFLLVPVMTFGWLVTSLFIWWMIEPLTWLESLAVAACVTATDPVLASSVVGKGKFAKRVPRHLRDVLSAESGCNDGMAFPFIYLSVYLIQYHLGAEEVTFHWFTITILYECVFGAVYGFCVGYIARHAIKQAHARDLIDRESFLVFYFVLALFVAGTGSSLGLDDLLVGFATGVGFSNDGWFQEKTEESHVSNVIDLLLNLAYFVYFGAIIPWDQYNNPALGLIPWKLVIIAIFVLLFRRIPIMMALKPIIPDIKNWREALFAGHFGPIGVGAIFAAILARAELEHESTQPLAVLPGPGEENYLIVQIIWPVVTFLVIVSIIVHGSSIAVFTLGKRINTLTLTMSYTTANEPTWLNRLPRISSISKSMSKSRGDFDSSDDADDRMQWPASTLPPVGYRGAFLRRQKEDDGSGAASRASSRASVRRKKLGAGGPISQSAIMPQRREDSQSEFDEKVDGETIDKIETATEKDETQEFQHGESSKSSPEVEAYQEGSHMIVEDKEGNVLQDYSTRGETGAEKAAQVEYEREELGKETSGEHAKNRHEPHEKDEGEEVKKNVAEAAEHPEETAKTIKSRLAGWNGWRKDRFSRAKEDKPEGERVRGPARAYQYGNTVIVEDEDGEVVKKYDIPARDRKKSTTGEGGPERPGLPGIRRMSTWTGFNKQQQQKQTDGGTGEDPVEEEEYDDDRRIRFTVGGSSRRMSKQDFIRQIQNMDPKSRAEAIGESDAKPDTKRNVKRKTGTLDNGEDVDVQRPSPAADFSGRSPDKSSAQRAAPRQAGPRRVNTEDVSPGDSETLLPVESHASYEEPPIPAAPSHPVGATLSRYSMGQPESAAARRRRLAAQTSSPSPLSPSPYSRAEESDSDDDGTERVPPGKPVQERIAISDPKGKAAVSGSNEGETAAEKRRRLAALGEGGPESDSDEDGGERALEGRRPVQEPDAEGSGSGENGGSGGRPGIRFAAGVNMAKEGGLATYGSIGRRR